MICLVIDTSSAAVTAGVVELSPSGSGLAGGSPDVRVLAQQVKVDARAHGELLAPFIKQALEQAGRGMRDLSAVIAGVGPGPFTGLRVGLVTAAAIADALGVSAYPVCSLDAIGLAAAAQNPSGDLLVAADARRREVYWATYRDGRRLTGPAVGKPAELVLSVAAMAGAGARLYAETLAFPLLGADDSASDSSSLDYPSVRALAQVAAADILAGGEAAPLTPLYLRRPDAVAATSVKSVSQ